MPTKEDFLKNLEEMRAIERKQAKFFRELAAEIEDEHIREVFLKLTRDEEEHEERLGAPGAW